MLTRGRTSDAERAAERIEIGPQPGPQHMFLSTPADVAVYGGAAGGGKTWALLLDPLRHVGNGAFSGVIFRRTYPMVRNEGGLWDTSYPLYTLLDAKPKETDFEWKFPSGATLRFAHMQHENNKLDWQGSQIPFIAFDELTHFSETQFTYVAFSRGRSMSNVKPYVRATCNPDASSWVKPFLAPWVDKTSPLRAESGEILWRTTGAEGGAVKWYRESELTPEIRAEAVSFTFIHASIFDNPILLKENPAYLAALKNLPPVERQRLLDGDWDVVPAAGKVFNRQWANFVTEVPRKPQITIVSSYGTKQEVTTVNDNSAPYYAVRFWDFASTEKELEGTRSNPEPDFTVGAKMMRSRDLYTMLHIVRGQIAAGEIEELVYEIALRDGYDVAVRWEIEGGSAGRILNASLMRKLQDFDAFGVSPQGSKLTRFKPVAQMAQAGGFQLLTASWNEIYLNELHHFPDKGWKKDQVDATSGAYHYLSVMSEPIFEGPDIFTGEPQLPERLYIDDEGRQFSLGAMTPEELKGPASENKTARERLRLSRGAELEEWIS